MSDEEVLNGVNKSGIERRMTTNPEKVYGFLKANSNHGFCDNCLEKKTGVDHHVINTITSTLALVPSEFVRTTGICPEGCSDRQKKITMAK